MKTFVATKNLGKLQELRDLFRGTELELDTYPLYAEPVEGESSYADNAALKAHALYQQLQQAGIRGAVIADDSGLEAAALGERPGVLSSRYQGPDATWPARRGALLEEMKDVLADKRDAKFCCAIMLILDGGSELTSYGEVSGSIAAEEHGKFGFGYDPIFFYPPANKTFAELDEDEKNSVSHRGRAAEALLNLLRARV